MTNIVVEIESEAEAALKWVGEEALDGLEALGKGALVIIEGVEPTVYAQMQAELTSFIDDAEAAKSIEDIEQDFLEHLESTGAELLEDALSLKGPLLQLAIAAVKGAL